MKDVEFEPGRFPLVNVESLDEALREALGAAVVGVSTGPSGVRVHMADDATPGQVAQARALVLAHDPSKLTVRQEAEMRRRQRLEQMRADNGLPLDVRDYAAAGPLLEQLARKVAWLEQEIAGLLRGG